MEDLEGMIETKTKKPRTQAQIDAFKKAQQIRLENAKKKQEVRDALKGGTKVVLVKEKEKPVPEPEPDIPLKEKPKNKPSAQPHNAGTACLGKPVVEGTTQALRALGEREVIYKKKPKVVYISSSEEEEEPEPEPPKIKKKVQPQPAPTNHLYSAIKFF
jgi:hypothetical protein